MEDKQNNTNVVAPKPAKRSRLKMKIRIPKGNLLVVVLLLAAVGSSVYFYTKYKDSQDKLKHPEIIAKAETDVLVAKVGQLTALPSGEQPTVATVSDVSKLSKQTFFANAQNGDKVLIYSQAKKAFLFRPSTNKIINIAPLNINTPTTTKTKKTGL